MRARLAACVRFQIRMLRHDGSFYFASVPRFEPARFTAGTRGG